MPKSVIIEIRAGTGGEEAALFAADLFRLYTKAAEKQNWSSALIDRHATELGGYREIVFEISGSDVYEKLRHEGGVHRVQRIPSTEKSGRVHTSTVSVAVLPEAPATELHVNAGDIRVDTLRASGPGGQYVNRRESAVRLTHLPSGLMVTCQEERTQLANKERAMKVLRARLYAIQRAKEVGERESERREQIGSAKRAEKIRTYNYPQNRITDHRLNKSWHQLDKIMNGDLKPVFKTFAKLKKKK